MRPSPEARGLRVLAKAAATVTGADAVKLLDQLATEAHTLADVHLLAAIEATSATEVARQLRTSRQAVQQRAERARRRRGGGS